MCQQHLCVQQQTLETRDDTLHKLIAEQVQEQVALSWSCSGACWHVNLRIDLGVFKLSNDYCGFVLLVFISGARARAGAGEAQRTHTVYPMIDCSLSACDVM